MAEASRRAPALLREDAGRGAEVRTPTYAKVVSSPLSSSYFLGQVNRRWGGTCIERLPLTFDEMPLFSRAGEWMQSGRRIGGARACVRSIRTSRGSTGAATSGGSGNVGSGEVEGASGRADGEGEGGVPPGLIGRVYVLESTSGL